MPCTVCTLLPVKTGWIAECGKTRQGPYLHKDMALRIATAAAQTLRRGGQDVRISILDETGAVSAAYCMCERFKTAQAQDVAG